MTTRTAKSTRTSPTDMDFIQLLFTDVGGRLKTLEVPRSRWNTVRDSGWTMDGSVLLGYGDPDYSDLRLVPDPETFVARPWHTPSGRSVGLVFCDVLDPQGRPFAADPRAQLRRAVERSEARGQLPVFGVEAEFYLLRAHDSLPVGEPSDSGGYWDLVEHEQADEVCRDISDALELMGLTVTGHHHEVCAGQREIVFQHGNALATADRLLLLKHTARTMARRRGMKAVFMPKPLAHLYGNALHVHVSLRGTDEEARPLFHSVDDTQGMSTLFRQSLAGVLEHADALTALGNPTVNSYKRLVPASGTPVHRSWARHNRSTAFKVVGDGAVPASMRLELRSPDPSTNAHLLFTAILAAFADGQDRDLKLGEACEESADRLSIPELAVRGITTLPTDLPTALRCLEEDSTVRSAVGELASRAWVSGSRADWNAWHRLVTSWELERYMESV
ncbi:glutamine synthetase family protein [Streptomyces sp. HSG2]|uniref:glutamine synthetase family protein n=1 Tax=Streptomyces sp. HSG2 TaxID=2797167 RepID=UPI001905762D|nr:glutamine synthetase family protein [Streptomyces sp. HSG2]